MAASYFRLAGECLTGKLCLFHITTNQCVTTTVSFTLSEKQKPSLIFENESYSKNEHLAV
jgi:hypothetical protein